MTDRNKQNRARISKCKKTLVFVETSFLIFSYNTTEGGRRLKLSGELNVVLSDLVIKRAPGLALRVAHVYVRVNFTPGKTKVCKGNTAEPSICWFRRGFHMRADDV